jgi:hypothetical protein
MHAWPAPYQRRGQRWVLDLAPSASLPPPQPSGEAAISAEPAQRLRATTSACRPPPAQTALTSSRAKHAGPISLRLSREPQGSSSSTPAAPRQRRRRGHAPSAPDNGERSTRGTSSPARHPSSRAHPRQPTAWPTHPSTTRTRTPTTSSSAPRGSSATRSPSSTRARPPAPAR